MDRVRENIDAGRLETDASLGAERANSADAAELEARSRRRFSDLIEHDRLVVGEQLFKLRDRADRLLAGEWLAAPSPDSSVAHERHAADEAMRGERAATDAILEQDRQRSDDAVTRRARRDLERGSATTRERRVETDVKLSMERHDVDDAVSALDDTRLALSRAETEKTRRQDLLAMVVHELATRSPSFRWGSRPRGRGRRHRDA